MVEPLVRPDGRPVDARTEERLAQAVDDHRLLALLVDVEVARAFDGLALRAARHGRLTGYYPAAGQESIVALAHALGPDDVVLPQYREQGLRLALGITPAQELAMFDGAQAAWDPRATRVLPPVTHIGAHLPHAVGHAHGRTLLGKAGATVAVFGDGAVSEGDFHAAASLAGLWNDACVLFCQNNGYAQTTPVARQSAAASIADRAAAYGLRAVQVDGMDPLAVLLVAAEVLADARRGDGAVLVESLCYRFGGHSSLDARREYRTRGEERRWRAEDPLLRLRAYVRHRGLDDDTVDAAVAPAVERLHEQVEQALEERPWGRAPSAAEVEEWCTVRWTEEAAAPINAATGAGLVAAATAAAMERDDRIVVLGQDVRAGGVLGATYGLAERFDDRVLDLPLNECGIVGAAIGLALAGMRPVAEIAFAGFAYTGLDQLVMQAARYRWRTGGALSVPLVLRAPSGAGHGGYEGHNEVLDAALLQHPGIAVLATARPEQAAAATWTALHADGPVAVLDATTALLATDPPEWDGRPLARGACVVDRADDAQATVVVVGAATAVAQEARCRLLDRGLPVDLLQPVDLRSPAVEAVAASLARTRVLVVVHDGPAAAGAGAEIVAALAEGDALPDGAVVVRVCAPQAPHGPAVWASATAVTADRIVAAAVDAIGARV